MQQVMPQPLVVPIMHHCRRTVVLAAGEWALHGQAGPSGTGQAPNACGAGSGAVWLLGQGHGQGVSPCSCHLHGHKHLAAVVEARQSVWLLRDGLYVFSDKLWERH